MARRNKRSGGDDFVELVARMPWWAGLALALASYLVLHQFATPPQGTLQPGQAGDFAIRSIGYALAYYGQFIVPALCVVAAFMSFVKRRKRETLVANITRSVGAEALNDMNWKEFEMLVGEAFRLQDYAVTELGGTQADGGVDLVLRKGTETSLVQCKQWKAFSVGVDVVRELYGVMAARGAAHGFVVTSGAFTPDAKAFAEGRNVSLLDGSKLFGLIQQAKRSLATTALPAASATNLQPVAPPVHAAPACPLCNSSMARRTAKKGQNAGSQFWGCSRYPICRGTR